ncbi:MAG: TetR family transcriptional regulator [Clostridiaceae bacterium BRH_c20a]|nr:MAG: TetR family transcriptional regulator [Clostridiaceae bacterium BRH_c20a]
MPKDTFFNLSIEKRQRIIDMAIDEFAKYSYDKVSISKIVDKAEIAKGSFYQYFEDKKDLYKYLLLNVIVEKKVNYLSHFTLKMQEESFFEVLKALYIAGINFAKDNPKLAEISDHFTKNTDDNLKKEIYDGSIPKSNALLEGLLLKGIAKGDLNPDIDIKLTAYILTSLTISIGEYFIKELKVEDDMEIMTLIDNMLLIFEKGIKNKG